MSSKPQAGKSASRVCPAGVPAQPGRPGFPPRPVLARGALARLAPRLALLGLAALGLQRAEGAGPVGGAQGRGGGASHRKGAKVLGGEGDHVGRLAQQQEEQEVGDERVGLRVLPQIAVVAETELLLGRGGGEPSLSRTPDPAPRAPGEPPPSLRGGRRHAGASQPPGVMHFNQAETEISKGGIYALDRGTGKVGATG